MFITSANARQKEKLMDCGLFFALMRYIIGKNLPGDSEYNRDNPANFHDTPCFLRKGVLGCALQRAKQAA